MPIELHNYGFTFDLSTAAMEHAGLPKREWTKIYKVEVPTALARAGFVRHPEGSVYKTDRPQVPGLVRVTLITALDELAPNFRRFVKRAHLFRCEPWSDLTLEFTANRAQLQPFSEMDDQQQIDVLLDRWHSPASRRRTRPKHPRNAASPKSVVRGPAYPRRSYR